MMVNFKQGTQATIEAMTSYEPGAFYVALDTGNTYLCKDDGTLLQLSGTSNITFSKNDPTSSDGSDGDLWFVYEA